MATLDIDKVVSALSEQLANLLKENAILRVLVSQLQSELDSVHETQVKEDGKGISTP